MKKSEEEDSLDGCLLLLHMCVCVPCYLVDVTLVAALRVLHGMT